MERLRKKFYRRAKLLREKIDEIREKYKNVPLAVFEVEHIFNGNKGIPSIFCETSKLDPIEGIRFRGYSIPELREKLPRPEGATEPTPEAVFLLMLLGEIPTPKLVQDFSDELKQRAQVPVHVFKVLDALPESVHPMAQFSIGIMALSSESLFDRYYREGLKKKYYWVWTMEDALNLLARIPRIAAYIYRKRYFNSVHIEPDYNLDWAANLAHMMGYDGQEIYDLFRLYMFLHSDHEGGNVSAHTALLVNSALSNPYYAFAAAMNGLAGPLHGLANQEVVMWIDKMIETLGTSKPSDEQIAEYVKKQLEEGYVIPGYGHAVLRATDPRFTAQMEFALSHIGQGKDDFIDIVHKLYRVVPPILQQTGKIKNPWPNVDAHSGALLRHYGITQHDFYTVLFGLSRAFGIMAQLIWVRALRLPIERPSSINIATLEKKINEYEKSKATAS